MDQKAIVKEFKMLARLSAFHEVSPFKVRAYERAAEVLKHLSTALFEQPVHQWPLMEGIGKSLRDELIEAETSGHLRRLRVLETETPKGLLPLLSSRIFSPSKLGQLWRALGYRHS